MGQAPFFSPSFLQQRGNVASRLLSCLLISRKGGIEGPSIFLRLPSLSPGREEGLLLNPPSRKNAGVFFSSGDKEKEFTIALQVI